MKNSPPAQRSVRDTYYHIFVVLDRRHWPVLESYLACAFEDYGFHDTGGHGEVVGLDFLGDSTGKYAIERFKSV